MEQSEISTLMRNYRAYRYAVRQYENTRAYPAAGIANYSGMPGGSGAPELFFDLVGKPADFGLKSEYDHREYQAYKSAVDAVESALDVLTEEEQSVVRLKWMEDISLYKIAERKHCDESTIRRMHKRAISQLTTALRFYTMPPITSDHIGHDQRGSGHMRYKNTEHQLF